MGASVRGRATSGTSSCRVCREVPAGHAARTTAERLGLLHVLPGASCLILRPDSCGTGPCVASRVGGARVEAALEDCLHLRELIFEYGCRAVFCRTHDTAALRHGFEVARSAGCLTGLLVEEPAVGLETDLLCAMDVLAVTVRATWLDPASAREWAPLFRAARRAGVWIEVCLKPRSERDLPGLCAWTRMLAGCSRFIPVLVRREDSAEECAGDGEFLRSLCFEGPHFVYIDGERSGGLTFCRSCGDELLIERYAELVQVRLAEGARCPRCDVLLAGIFAPPDRAGPSELRESG